MDKFGFNGTFGDDDWYSNEKELDADSDNDGLLDGTSISPDTEFNDEAEFEAGIMEGEAVRDVAESNDSADFDFDAAFEDDWGTPVDESLGNGDEEKDWSGTESSDSWGMGSSLDGAVSKSDDDFDIDALFGNDETELGAEVGYTTNEEVVVDMDLSKYENASDSGNPVVLALVAGRTIVYLAHGTQGKLAATIKFLEQSIGANLMQIPLGDENIEELKNDAKAFNLHYRKYVEGEQNE